MKKINLFLLLAFLFSSFNMNAQFEFKLSYDFDTEIYTASLIPQATYTGKDALTSDGQITLKVPANLFIPVEIQSSLSGMTWEANSIVHSPEEAPEYDYISFALQISGGVAYPEYEEGVEIILFTFKNAYGCQAGTGNPNDAIISIVDNNNDPFMPPNSANANIGNSFSVLGANMSGSTFGFGGLYNGGSVSCDPANPTSTAEELGFSSFRVFPNPVETNANVEINWEGEAQEAILKLVDPAGKLISQEPISIANGKNTKRLNVANLPAGSYFLYLTGEDWEVSLDKMNKQ